MDLSFTRFDRAPEVGLATLLVLLVGVAARQAASRTAVTQARLSEPARPCRFTPSDGRFNAGAARALADWKGG